VEFCDPIVAKCKDANVKGQRNRILKQFQDETKPVVPKDKFTISPQDLEKVKAMMESMTKDLAAAFPEAVKKTVVPPVRPDTTPQQGTQGQIVTPGSQGDKAVQAATKPPAHARSGSKSGGPPAAPTTSQPPFPLGASSPHGQPVYTGNPKVTQDTLQLPARKKAKFNGPGGGGSQSSGASPKIGKGASPELQKRLSVAEAKGPARPRFTCAEPGCEYHTIGFATEEAKQTHVQDEHIKPYEDPAKFVMESVAVALGLNADGSAKSASQDDSAMKRSASFTGAKAADMMKVESSQGTKALAIGVAPDKVDGAMAVQHMAPNDSINFIDPQDLFSNYRGLEFGGGGAISDMSVYRSITPNDTPESSKDSASSEPNSDISDGMTLNVTLDMGLDSWQPFDGDQHVSIDQTEFDLLNNHNHNNNNNNNSNDLSMMGDQGLADFTTWDEVNPDFDKPFAFDESLYSFDTAGLNTS
jgi:hypothetical protein